MVGRWWRGRRVVEADTGRAGGAWTPEEDARAAVEAEALERAVRRATLVAGRPTDAQADTFAKLGYQSLVPRPNETSYKPRPGRTTLQTLRLVADRDPKASQAVSNYILMLTRGYHSLASRGVDGQKKPIPDQGGSALLADLDARVGADYGGGMDQVVSVLAHMLVVQGAISLWVQMAEDLGAVEDFTPIDPAFVQFKVDKGTGKIRRGIMVDRSRNSRADQDGFLELPEPQFIYIPYQPAVENFYGRSPILASLAAIFFKVQLLEDLQAVLHNQGYPRMLVTVMLEAVIKNAPRHLQAPGQEKQLDAWVGKFFDRMEQKYTSLKPDDTLITTDNVTIAGLKAEGATVDLRAIVDILQKEVTSGLKMLPMELGENEGNTSTHATVQWRYRAYQIGALQRPLKRGIERAHTLALNVAGYQSRAAVGFESQPATDAKIDAETRKLQIDNWARLIQMGLASQEEVGMDLTGHAPVGPAQAPPPAPAAVPDEDVAPTIGEDARGAGGRLAHRPWAEGRPVRWWKVKRRYSEALPDGLTVETRADGDPLAPVEAAFEELVAEQFRALDSSALVEAEAEGDVDDWFEGEGGADWLGVLAAGLFAHYLATFNRAGQLTVDALADGYTFDLTNQELRDALEAFAGERTAGIDDVTRQRLKRALLASIEADGVDATKQAAALRAAFAGMAGDRAHLIAVTETTEAASRAGLETGARNGIARKAWSTMGDDRVTDGCRENEGAGPIPVGDRFTGGASDVLHPPRFPGCRCHVLPVVPEDYTPPATVWTGQ